MTTDPVYRITYYRIRPVVNEDEQAARVIHVRSGVEVRSALDVPKYMNRRIAMTMAEAYMSVLDKAANVGKGGSNLIPVGATGVVATGDSKGWNLVFETPQGEVTVVVGEMDRAVKLAMRLAGVIARSKS